MAKAKKMSPYQAKTFDQVCTLKRDNKDFGDEWWMLIQAGDDNHEVVITKQRSGEDKTEQVHIPREIFIRMCRWYMTPTNVSRSKP